MSLTSRPRALAKGSLIDIEGSCTFEMLYWSKSSLVSFSDSLVVLGTRICFKMSIFFAS